MKTLKLFLILVVVAMFIAACANEQATKTATNTLVNNAASSNGMASPTVQNSSAADAPGDEFAAAKVLYEKHNCVACHQSTGEGGKNIQYGDVTIDNVPSFKNPKVAAESDAHYLKKINNGGDGMPKFKGKLTDDEMKLLVRYIRSEFQGK